MPLLLLRRRGQESYDVTVPVLCRTIERSCFPLRPVREECFDGVRPPEVRSLRERGVPAIILDLLLRPCREKNLHGLRAAVAAGLLKLKERAQRASRRVRMDGSLLFGVGYI